MVSIDNKNIELDLERSFIKLFEDNFKVNTYIQSSTQYYEGLDDNGQINGIEYFEINSSKLPYIELIPSGLQIDYSFSPHPYADIIRIDTNNNTYKNFGRPLNCTYTIKYNIYSNSEIECSNISNLIISYFQTFEEIITINGNTYRIIFEKINDNNSFYNFSDLKIKSGQIKVDEISNFSEFEFKEGFLIQENAIDIIDESNANTNIDIIEIKEKELNSPNLKNKYEYKTELNTVEKQLLKRKYFNKDIVEEKYEN